ncbi:MAG: lamin tail domain-containing protein, partial [Bacteroidota bacterium]
VISEIMADPSPAQGLPEEEFIELLNISNTTYNLKGLSLAKSSGEVDLPDRELAPGEYIAFVGFGAGSSFTQVNVVGLEGLFSFSNDGDSIVLRNRIGEIVDVVEYELSWYRDTEKDNGGFSLELINPFSECGGAANWMGSTDPLGGTPGSRNASFSDQIESQPPLILNSQLLDATRLEVQFNEEMDPATLLTSKFSIEGFEIASVMVGERLEEVLITFDQEVPTGQLLELDIEGVADCSGNVIVPSSIGFGLGRPPAFLDLLITEIFSDPDPMISLPDAEYLEIQNVSNDLITLSNVRVRDATGRSQPIGGIIGPGEILVLASSGELIEFVNLLPRGVASWRSLTNSGERLALIYEDTDVEQVIFQIDFQGVWHDPEKRDGGYSLEMRDTGNPCGQARNWGSSVDPAGGTPGRTNSIRASVPDNFGPQLLNAFALTSDSVRLDFDESLLTPLGGMITISEGVEVSETLSPEDQPNQLFLTVNPPLENGVEYKVLAQDIRDCLGNMRSDNEVLLVLPVEALPGEVLLSEVLFDPKPDGFDFVEVYNTTDLYLTLKDWRVENANDSDPITTDELIIGPAAFLVLTENKDRLLLDYPQAEDERIFEVGGLPTFSNDEGIVKIVDNRGRVQDSLFYQDDFHNPLLADREGVSLERIDFSAPNVADNWVSASSTFGFATPGFANSQSRTAEVSRGEVVADPSVFIPGGSNTMSAFTTINYDFETPGQFANINLYDQNGRLVRRLAEGLALASRGFVTWDGTNDAGAAVRMGYYLIVFEVFGANGSSEVIKETVVVGRDF